MEAHGDHHGELAGLCKPWPPTPRAAFHSSTRGKVPLPLSNPFWDIISVLAVSLAQKRFDKRPGCVRATVD